MLVLAWAVAAHGQQPVIHDVETAVAVARQDMSSACLACEVPWTFFPQGRLWSDYCLEQELAPCPGPSCRNHPAPGILNNVAGVGSVRVPSLRPLVPTWRTKRKHHGLLNLDLFCDLMGWRACTCSGPDACGCQHRQTAQPRAAQPHPAAPPSDESGPVPVPAVELDEDALPSTEVPEAAHDGTPNERAPQRRVLPGLEVDPPATQDGVPTPPDPPAAPAVPRNTLPSIQPASNTPSRPAKVLVAQRLSDYIKL